MTRNVRRSLGTAAAVALAIVLFSAGGAPAQQPDPAEQAAAGACAQLQVDMGAGFTAKFGSLAGCVGQVAAAIRSAGCMSLANPESCVQQAVQRVVGSGGGGLPSADELAQQMCTQLQGDLGARFKTLFGSFAGCLGKVKPIASAAIAKCRSAADARACIEQESRKELAALQGGGASAEQIADAIATQACEAAKAELGTSFAKQLGSLDACRNKIAAKALEIARQAIARCKNTGDEEGCIRSEAEAEAKVLQFALGAGAAPGVSELASTVAGEACQAAKQKLGGSFDKRLGSLDSCKASIQTEARRLAGEALTRCQGVKDREGCIRQQLETAALSLRYALGAGAEPSIAQIADEIAGGACQAAREQLGSRFAPEHGSLDACKAKLGRMTASIADSVAKACQTSSDREACMRQGIEKSAVSLQFELGAGAPNAAQIGDAVASEACTAVYVKVMNPRFQRLLGSLEACRKKIQVTATRLAAEAIAKCKTAWDKDVCIRQAIETGAVGLEAALGVTPSAAEVGDEVAGEACETARQRLKAGFEKRFGSIDGCKAKVRAQATQLAAGAIGKCKSAAVVPVCLRQAIEAAAATLEAALGLK